MCVCIALCTIVAHNIAQNRPDNFPSYPLDNHHCSDDVYLREGGARPIEGLECASLPNAVFAASSAKNFKMNLCKVNFDIHLAPRVLHESLFINNESRNIGLKLMRLSFHFFIHYGRPM